IDNPTKFHLQVDIYQLYAYQLYLIFPMLGSTTPSNNEIQSTEINQAVRILTESPDDQSQPKHHHQAQPEHPMTSPPLSNASTHMLVRYMSTHLDYKKRDAPTCPIEPIHFASYELLVLLLLLRSL